MFDVGFIPPQESSTSTIVGDTTTTVPAETTTLAP